jgi:hypothetical protein
MECDEFVVEFYENILCGNLYRQGNNAVEPYWCVAIPLKCVGR